MSGHTFWAALIGFAIGSAQTLTVDWIRHRSRHRIQLRLLRAELRRLAGFTHKWNYEHGVVPPDDATPNPPSVTPSFERLLQEIDFWLTDEHNDDNTQQGLIDIADGATILQRYDAAARSHIELATAATSVPEKQKHLARAVDNTKVYDKELDRWRTMVGSALIDAERRLRIAGFGNQLMRVGRRLSAGTNPPPSPPIQHPPSEH